MFIKPKREYNWTYGFTNGLACIGHVEPDGHTITGAVINKAGEFVSPPDVSITEFFGDFAVARFGGKFGVVDRQFKFVIKPDFDVLVAEAGPYFSIEDALTRHAKSPLFYYALKNDGEPAVVLSTRGDVLFNLPEGIVLPNGPRVHDGVIDCPVWKSPNAKKSVFLDMKGNKVADPLEKLPKLPYVSYREIAPGFLLETVKHQEPPSVRSSVSAQQTSHAGLPYQTICISGQTERQQHRYVAYQRGMMLFNNATKLRKWYGYLLIDNTRTPALYLCTRKNTATERSHNLQDLSETDLHSLVSNVKQTDRGIYKFDAFGWTSKWTRFHITLNFVCGHCGSFKVVGPGIENVSWLDTVQIPKEITTSSAAIPLPVEIVCGVDGPRDCSHGNH